LFEAVQGLKKEEDVVRVCGIDKPFWLLDVNCKIAFAVKEGVF
jgi:hypothetical protein